MANKLFLIIILIYGTCVYAQQTTSGISPDRNLIAYSVTPANNNASAKVPLRSMDATSDEGLMPNKLREGYGRSGYSDPSVNSQNRRHKFMDRRHMAPYAISSSRYVSRSTITRSSAKANEVKLRISEENSNFSGDATLFFRIKNSNEDEINEDITIKEKDIAPQSENNISFEPNDEVILNLPKSNAAIRSSSETIVLNPKANLTTKRENSIIYKSKTEYIREYELYEEHRKKLIEAKIKEMEDTGEI